MSGFVVSMVYAAVIGGLVGLALVFFLRSLESRRFYRCLQCGERFRVELMDASHCNTCGAPVSGASHGR